MTKRIWDYTIPNKWWVHAILLLIAMIGAAGTAISCGWVKL
jgi:hypothetical protein